MRAQSSLASATSLGLGCRDSGADCESISDSGRSRLTAARQRRQRSMKRFRVTRAALPLVVIAGVGEVIGSMLSAWGSRDSIAITAVMGSQFAAIAAVAAYFLFGERLGRLQVAGVALIVGGVAIVAATTA